MDFDGRKRCRLGVISRSPASLSILAVEGRHPNPRQPPVPNQTTPLAQANITTSTGNYPPPPTKQRQPLAQATTRLVSPS